MVSNKNPEDQYSRVDYRRMVAWPERIKREAPFLRAVLYAAPSLSVLDLGCGTGEHSRFLVEEGYQVVGLDRSETMLEKARELVREGQPELILGDLRQLEQLSGRSFGAAICLGNTLVHVKSEAELEAVIAALSGLLLQRGLFLFQILNYRRLIEKNIRYLPLNFVAEEQGDRETVFLRLMDFRADGKVIFCPTAITYERYADKPLKIRNSRRVELKAWTLDDLKPLLERAGFRISKICGDMSGGVFRELESTDLVVVASKQ